jgi:hypothetical protein
MCAEQDIQCVPWWAWRVPSNIFDIDDPSNLYSLLRLRAAQEKERRCEILQEGQRVFERLGTLSLVGLSHEVRQLTGIIPEISSEVEMDGGPST